MKLYVDDQVVAEDEMRTIMSRYSLCGEGLCIGYDGGDAVSAEYKPKFEFSGGRIVKVVFDVADDAYIDVGARAGGAGGEGLSRRWPCERGPGLDPVVPARLARLGPRSPGY